MISEISSLLSQADAKLARSGGHKFSANLNRNRIRSISSYSSNSIFYFPVILSDQATPEEVTMVSQFLEKSYASFVIACIGLMPFHRIKADDQASIEEYLSQFHQNLGINNGNGSAIYKAMNAAGRLSESSELENLNKVVVEAVKGGITDEDLAITQDFLQECWEKSRKNSMDYINVVNESITSLNEKFDKDPVDPVTRTLQEAHRATMKELETWGFLGEADVKMNFWDDVESMSDDELVSLISPYSGETISDFDDDEDLEEEYPELDAMLESSWEDLYNKAKETMSNSQAVAWANEKFAQIKDKAAKAKEVAVQKTKDVTSDISNRIKGSGSGSVKKSEAEILDDKLDQEAKDQIKDQIIKEDYGVDTTGALDRQNAQVAADEKRHQAEDMAKRKNAATNARTAVEQQKAATAAAKEQRKQTELELEQQKLAAEQQGVTEAAGSVMLKAKLDAAKVKAAQARENGETPERVAAAQAQVQNQLVQNQAALAAAEEAESRNKPLSPIQAMAKKAKEQAGKVLSDAQPDKAAPTNAQVAYGNGTAQNEGFLGSLGRKSPSAPKTQTTMSQDSIARMQANLSAMNAAAKHGVDVNKAAAAAVNAANKRIGLKYTVEAASMGQAVESIKYSLQSVSAEKINGCKSISQLNKLETKLKTLRSRYTSYLNRYKKKAQEEEKNGNKVLVKLHSATIGDPKAFMLQYGDYIKEINARLEMIRRRKKALAPDIGKPVEENAFATIGDMELSAIDYCIEAVNEMVNADDDDVFDVVVDESFNKTDKKIPIDTPKPKIDTSVDAKADLPITDFTLLHKATKGISHESVGAMDEAKSFGDQYEALTKQYNTILDRMVKNKRFLLCFKIGSNNRKLTGWTGKGGIIPAAMNDEDLAKLEEFILKRQESGLFLVPDADGGYYDDTADLVDLILKRRKILAQMKLASPDSTIPKEKIDELHKIRDEYLKASKEAARIRREQEFRAKELEIKQQEADARKNMGVAAAAAAATYALNSVNAARNESVETIDEANGQNPNNPGMKNKETTFAGEVKKLTGAAKDAYDIINAERERNEKKDQISYTKVPRTTDRPDGIVYNQRNRQRGNINVAAAANAKEQTYQGHKTFDKEVFTNMDMKKANETIPTFAKATIGFIVDETEQVVTRDVLIGVKTTVHVIRAKELISELYNTLINKRKFLKFVKWLTSEEKSLTDLMFGITELKIDANSTRNSSAARWMPAFRRRKRLSKIAIPYLLKDYLPNGTLVMTKGECDYIKSEYGIDIMTPEHIDILMRDNFLLGIVILDQGSEICYVSYDGHNGVLQQYSYAALVREEHNTDRMLRDLYRSINR